MIDRALKLTGVKGVAQYTFCDVRLWANRGQGKVSTYMRVKRGASGWVVGARGGGRVREDRARAAKICEVGGVGYEGVPHSAYTSPTKNFSDFTLLQFHINMT